MRRLRILEGHFSLLGSQFPRAVGIWVGLILGLSVLGAVSFRSGARGLLELSGLQPMAVWQGEIWRLVTWSFFELDALGLIFAALVIFFFGRDLCYSWGATRFFMACLGLAAGAGALTCLIGRVWPALLSASYFTAWPVAEALIIAWATYHPGRTILLYFVLPVSGRNLVYITIGGTLLFALLHGFAGFVPHFCAQGLMLAHLHGFSPRELWLRYKLRQMQWRPRRRPSHLKPVSRGDEPPRWLH
jgi:membrane associated rhomboid family serine protease